MKFTGSLPLRAAVSAVVISAVIISTVAKSGIFIASVSIFSLSSCLAGIDDRSCDDARFSDLADDILHRAPF